MQTQQDIIDAFRNGKVILFPTDTIWGLGCSIHNLDAVHRIYTIKKRELSKPFPILVDSIEMLKEYTNNIHPRVETLLTHHTYPLTLIYPEAKDIDPPVADVSGSIAIRIVQDSFCAELIRKIGAPIVATSANLSGESFPRNFSEISEDIKSEVDLVVAYRQDEKKHGEPSIIAKYDHQGNLNFLRT